MMLDRARVAALAAVLPCAAAHGGVIGTYELATDEPKYFVNQNGTIDIPIYLVETTDLFSFLEDEDGLFSAQFSVSRGIVPTDPAFISGAAGDPAFDDFLGPTIDVGPELASVFQLVDILALNGVLGEIVDGRRRVPLGTVTITGGSVLGEETEFVIFDDPTFDDNLTFLGNTPIDDRISSTSFLVTVVPSPGAAAFLLFGACVARRRHR